MAAAPAPIPRGLPDQEVLFSARRYVSNGFVPDITHVVYVDPQGYADLPTHADLLAVGRAVSKLNKILPKRGFILMGPGRWGSRGDVKLGVSVTYSDINNTSLLIEIARKKGQYVPDLSFGTHFFQDLVEASIRYLPLYPDDPGILFNESFLLRSRNLLRTLVPEHGDLADVVRVIDVPAVTGGRVLRVLMNADLDEAVAHLSEPGTAGFDGQHSIERRRPRQPQDHWHWRQQMAERLAAGLWPGRLGVQALYLLGSTRNASAGPLSDIDLLVHFRGSEAERAQMERWFEGWSLALAEMNFQRTGHRHRWLIDLHVVGDEDLAAGTGWAARIGAINDAARGLTLGPPPKSGSQALPQPA
jgi:hypothetical protein